MDEYTKISQMTQALSVANNDKFYIETAGGEKSITFGDLKTAQERYFQKEGTPIWDSETGATNITGLTVQVGHFYELWVTSSLARDDAQKVIVYIIESNLGGGETYNGCARFIYFTVWSGCVVGEAYIKNYNSIGTNGRKFDGTYVNQDTERPLIFKVIDMGELNLNEV